MRARRPGAGNLIGVSVTRRQALLGMAAGATILSAPAGGMADAATTDPDWDRVVRDAKKEGRVVLYSAYPGLLAHRDIQRDFEAAYGIKVELLEARASELRERIRMEQVAGRFAVDVSENGRTTTTLQIEEDHVFEPHGPLPSLGRLRPEFASDGTRLPIFAIVYGILANARLVKPADAPKSWLDLTDPRWKGKILSDDLRALGGGAVFFSVMQDRFGRAFHEKLATQGLQFGRDIAANERRVAQGEFPLYIPEGLSGIPPLKGLPVTFLAPQEGLPYVSYELALAKNAPHPNAARLLMEHYLGRQTQQAFAKLGLAPVTADPPAQVDPAVAAFEGDKLLGTTDPARQNAMLALAQEIYR
jgi:iron(III) transport system substrate-binding protein